MIELVVNFVTSLDPDKNIVKRYDPTLKNCWSSKSRHIVSQVALASPLACPLIPTWVSPQLIEERGSYIQLFMNQE